MSGDLRFMRLALSLGRRGLGQVWPNPAVGCVIVKDGVIVGRGSTAPGGRPHAETIALAQAGRAARGADVYVTLEPCAHHGQTPPCATALITAGVARVIVAIGDPDARVAGRGLAMLRDAGIAVETGLCADTARADQAGFLLNRTAGRPLVTLKLALTLDGRIATRTGDSRWITGPAARRAVHAMRARHDAVMVGGGTARADDPMLDVRDLGIRRQPVRVVVSSGVKLPRDGKLVRSATAQPVWVMHGKDAQTDNLAQSGLRLFACPVRDGGVDIAAALAELATAGITRVLCEGGGSLAASLLSAACVDRLVIMTGGAAIGADGVPGLAALGLDRLAAAPRFALRDVTRLGPDVMATWVPTGS